MAVENKVYILRKSYCDYFYGEYKDLVLGVFDTDKDKIQNAMKTVSMDIIDNLHREHKDTEIEIFDDIWSNKPHWKVYLPYKDIEVELFYEEYFLNTL